MLWRNFALLSLCPAAWADSRECAPCHASIWESYQRTGMARSFSRAERVESASFYHAASDTYFAFGAGVQKQYQIVAGKQTNASRNRIVARRDLARICAFISASPKLIFRGHRTLIFTGGRKPRDSVFHIPPSVRSNFGNKTSYRNQNPHFSENLLDSIRYT